MNNKSYKGEILQMRTTMTDLINVTSNQMSKIEKWKDWGKLSRLWGGVQYASVSNMEATMEKK